MSFVGGVLWWIVLGALVGWVAAWWAGRSSQRLLAEPVLQIVERRVDNPQHVARIATLEREAALIPDLERQAATIPTLQARIVALQSAPPRIVEKIVSRTVDRVIEKVVEKPVDRVVERIVERAVPDTAALAERDTALGLQRRRLEHLEALAAVQAERLVEARATPQTGADLMDPADIEIVEGIGPRIAQVLRSRGFGSFDALAQASPGTLREILDDQGPAYRIADPSTWPEQARLAAQGSWDELKSLQDSLTAGRRN